MRRYKIVTVSQSGTIAHYHPPETTPHKTVVTPTHSAVSNTLPLLTHHKSSIHHPTSKTRIPTTPITALTTLPPLLVTGNSEGFVNLHYPTTTTTLPLHVSAVTELRVCDAGETLLSSSIDGFVHLTRLSNPTQPFSSLPHALPVTAFSLGYSSSTARVITASTDRSTRVWHLSSAKLLTTVRHEARVAALAIGVAEDYYWGDVDGRVGHVRIADLPVGGVVRGVPFARREAAVSALVASPEGLVAGFEDGVVQVFDRASKVLLRSFGGGAGIARVFVEYEDEGDDAMFEGIGVGGDVVVGERRTSGVWEEIKELAEDAFEEVVVVREDRGEEARLREEVERLTRRNRELEDAGKRLIELVER